MLKRMNDRATGILEAVFIEYFPITVIFFLLFVLLFTTIAYLDYRGGLQ